MTSNGKLWRVSLCLCLRFHSLEHTCGFMYVLYMCCQGVVYTKLAGSMYDIHANEDICDFKRGVCHKLVILTNIFAVVFWRIISFVFENPSWNLNAQVAWPVWNRTRVSRESLVGQLDSWANVWAR